MEALFLYTKKAWMITPYSWWKQKKPTNGVEEKMNRQGYKE